MRTSLCTLPLLLYIALESPPLEASIYRCEDAHGHVTFTQLGCPDDELVEVRERVEAMQDSPALLPPAKIERITRNARKEQAEKPREIEVVGERQDGCGNRIVGQERRQAMLRKQVRTGMTRRDVESMLGKPDKISRTNGQTRYHYVAKKGKGRSQLVTFDEHGCVKGGR
ncbi:hypothetical protein HNP29_000905 [Pseudomonas alcaligenes]|nr:hypothetical protein [Pseudomonas alcaligenes]